MSSLSSNNNKPSSIIRTNAPKKPTHQILELHYNNIRKLNIEKYAVELDTYGYCIVPPEVHGVSMETINKLKESVSNQMATSENYIQTHIKNTRTASTSTSISIKKC